MNAIGVLGFRFILLSIYKVKIEGLEVISECPKQWKLEEMLTSCRRSEVYNLVNR